MHILIATAIFPDMADNQTCNLNDAHWIYEQMIQKGNKVAEARRTELNILEIAFQQFAIRVKQQELETFSWIENTEGSGLNGQPVTEIDQRNEVFENLMESQQDIQQGNVTGEQFPRNFSPNTALLPSITRDPQSSENVEFLDDLGISSEAFFSLLDQMDGQNYSLTGSFETFSRARLV
jgi:proline utilization trans-activator